MGFASWIRRLFKLNVEVEPLNKKVLLDYINDFRSSKERHWMLTGERYFNAEPDINQRQMIRYENEKPVIDTTKVNNRLSHPSYTKMVNEKVNYLLTKDYTMVCENDVYIKQIKDVLGHRFKNTLKKLGYQASNKGIAWLHVYIENGAFKTLVLPSEQIIPVWADDAHEELLSVIRFYDERIYDMGERKTITKVEHYHAGGIDFYRLESDRLVDDMESVSHYEVDGVGYNWGRVPFIPFKNNMHEIADIKLVKALVDSYDLSRSELANFIEEVRSLIYVLKGYGGESMSDFMRDLTYYRAISIDDPDSGGVDVLNPTMDVEAIRVHYEQLKRDLMDLGMSVNKDLDKIGSSPSGVALKFLYSGLDLKCNDIESEFKVGFEELLFFVNAYLRLTGQSVDETYVELIFNRDITINEMESVEMCVQSKGVVSDETIIANHPWTTDVESELAKVKAQNEENLQREQEAFNSYNDVDDNDE